MLKLQLKICIKWKNKLVSGSFNFLSGFVSTMRLMSLLRFLSVAGIGRQVFILAEFFSLLQAFPYSLQLSKARLLQYETPIFFVRGNFPSIFTGCKELSLGNCNYSLTMRQIRLSLLHLL